MLARTIIATVSLFLTMAAFTPKASTDVSISKDDPAVTAELEKLKSDAKLLEAGITDLQSKQDKWDKRYLDLVVAVVIFGALSALLGAGTFFAQKRSSALGHKVREKSNLLANNNGRVSILEKGQSDERIAQANLLARRAGEQAERTATENIKLKGSLDLEIANSQTRAEELHKQNLTTEDTLEKERDTRLQLEKSLAPRRLELGMSYIKKTGKNVTTVDALRAYTGAEFILNYFPDAEAKRAAEYLNGALQAAGWKCLRLEPREDIQDGVTIFFYHPARQQSISSTPRTQEDLRRQEEQRQRDYEETKSMWAEADMAEAVVKYLTANNWAASKAFSKPGELRPNVLKIEVGLKPAPYFEEPQHKLTMDQLDKAVHEDETNRPSANQPTQH